jgi:GPH family glycoside/pentoside/hexuronide:cation symporter
MKPLSLPMLLSYGLFGLPLAMVALPIYVYLPQFYAQRGGISLALVGAALLGARIVAAFIDPLIGWWIDRGGGAFGRWIGVALPLLLAGFVALFHPPALGTAATLAWFLISLMVVYLGFSTASIAHQSWGAALTQVSLERTRVTGVREACGLAGVVLAAAIGGALGYSALSFAFGAALAGAGALLLLGAPRAARDQLALTPPHAINLQLALAVPRATRDFGPSVAVPRTMRDDWPLDAVPPPANPWRALATPFKQVRFRSLFSVLLVNGVASAIPATLFLFFAADRLQLAAMSGLFLILYFAAAAFSMPLWITLAARLGAARAWVVGMLLSALVFVWAYVLDAGALAAFATICLLSGLALGADLALPPALLAAVIGRAGHQGRHEAVYFGVWNWGVQMTLALAAGIALPLLAWLGYVPGQQSHTAALAGAYALLPCAMKLTAAAMLWRAPLRDC